MFDELLDKVNEIYNMIKNDIDSRFIVTAIKKYKKDLNIDKVSFGQAYFNFISYNKKKGIVYTPVEIAEYIIKNTISDNDVIKNPYIKICDPSCGTGNLLIPCFEYLRGIYFNNLESINAIHELDLTLENINEHIIKNNIFGFDVDENAIKILEIDLFEMSNCKHINVLKKDFLMDELNNKFDIIIGNPPYIGQKSIEREYSLKLKQMYKSVYKDKGDISYCFFDKGLNQLGQNGKLSFITSRYFMESPSGSNLRKLLFENSSINRIIDFYGIRPFKGFGIDPVIIFLSKTNIKDDIKVIKPQQNKIQKKQFCDSLFNSKGNEYKEFNIAQSELDCDRWILLNDIERSIIRKIEEKCINTLDNLCESNQGIITGCDKVFIVDKETIEKKKLEEDIIKPWIKSSNIHKGRVSYTEKYLICSDLIDSEDNYPNVIEHIKQEKNRLENRRECKKGYRKWYQLQWGRKKEIFENRKIVFPYKSSMNRFALDKGNYYSADVYSLTMKKETDYTYDFMLYILNSKIYQFYFKTFAKKLGEDLYEYYPNTLMKLCIPQVFDFEINNENTLYKYFGLTNEEIEIIIRNTIE